MFGDVLAIPVPDIDRTDHLLMLGANPLVSNGSLMTAPDLRGRLRGDPRARRQGRRRSIRAARETAERGRRAPLHPPRHRRVPAARAWCTCCSPRAWSTLGRARRARRRASTRSRRWPRDFTPEAVAPRAAASTPSDIRAPRARARRRRARRRLRPHRHLHAGVRHARELARRRAQRAHRPPRRAGRRDVPQAPPPARRTRRGEPGRGRGVALGPLARAACAALPEVFGELPVACLAEEIETPGEGQVRALITRRRQPGAVGAERRPPRPPRSTTLEFMCRIDIYLNETTRHADVILPGAVAARAARTTTSRFYQLAVRNVRATTRRRCSRRPTGMPPEWQTLLRLTGVVAGPGRRRRPRRARRPRRRRCSRRELADPTRRSRTDPASSGRARAAARPGAAARPLLRAGPYDASTLDGTLEAERRTASTSAPLEPRVPEVLRTPSGQDRAGARADRRRRRRGCGRRSTARRNGGMVLIGRRQLRSNNSWMHNLPRARRRAGPLHAARAPRRRRAARPRRRRHALVRSRAGDDRGRRSRSPTR